MVKLCKFKLIAFIKPFKVANIIFHWHNIDHYVSFILWNLNRNFYLLILRYIFVTLHSILILQEALGDCALYFIKYYVKISNFWSKKLLKLCLILLWLIYQTGNIISCQAHAVFVVYCTCSRSCRFCRHTENLQAMHSIYAVFCRNWVRGPPVACCWDFDYLI